MLSLPRGAERGGRAQARAWLCAAGALLAACAPPAAAAAAAAAPLCAPGRQFWDEARGRCADCAACRQPGHIVLRPCHVHQDTLCGPVRHADVERAWSRARGAAPAAPADAAPPPPPRPADHWHRRAGGRWASSSSSAASSSTSSWSSVVHVDGSSHRQAASSRRSHVQWRHSDSSSSSGESDATKQRQKPHRGRAKHHHLHHHHHHNHHQHHQQQQQHHRHRQKARPPESAAQVRGGAGARPPPPPSPPPRPSPRPSPAPFSAAEALAWDWQAAALVAAVGGCALFFGAAALHGLRQLRTDAARSADADNLSATLSLMVPEMANDIPENCTVESCNTNQCLYMEQLLVRKHEELKEGQGNVYIDRGNGRINV